MSYTYSRLFGNYAGLANSDEITTPTTGVSSATTQQQGGSVSRQGGNANRAWDLDEVLFTSHGATASNGTCTPVQGAACVTDGVMGRLATDRPHVVKLYGAYTLPFGTQVGVERLRRQRHANQHLRRDAEPDEPLRQWPW